jgi:hypothetical protein
MERKRVSLIGPTLLIGLGVILLLNNLGYLDWSVWDVLQLWPVLLIAAGLEILLGRRSIWGSLVAALLLLMLIVGGVFLVEQLGPDRAPGEVIEIAQPMDGAETLILDLDASVANLTIEPLDDSANLVEGTVQLWSSEDLEQRFTGGERARLVLDSETRGSLVRTRMGRATEWRLQVSPEVRTRLSVNFGVGEGTFRLAELAVDDADIDFGVGQVEITLSRTASGDVVVDGGIGTIRVVVPRDLGVRIVADAGLVTRRVPGSYSRDGQIYTSPNWDQADNRTTVTLNLGIGTITVVDSASR